MSQTVLTRNKDFENWPAGQYRRTQQQEPLGSFSAVITCPGCGVRGSLSATHDVHPDGVVQPSVLCECGFHEFITLEGYDE